MTLTERRAARDVRIRRLAWQQNVLLAGLRRHRSCVDGAPCRTCRDERTGIVLLFRRTASVPSRRP
jgi:hypothetical protein